MSYSDYFASQPFRPNSLPRFSPSGANFIILYVQDPPASADFYSVLLGRPVVERAPTFAMLPLCQGVMLGLWSETHG